MEFLSFPWEILPFKWSSPTNSSVKDGFPIVIYYPWQAATLPPNQPPFTITQPSLQGSRRLPSGAPFPKATAQSTRILTGVLIPAELSGQKIPPFLQWCGKLTWNYVHSRHQEVQQRGLHVDTIYPPMGDHHHKHNPPDCQKTCFLSSKDPPC